jgi:hypothetical protein
LPLELVDRTNTGLAEPGFLQPLGDQMNLKVVGSDDQNVAQRQLVLLAVAVDPGRPGRKQRPDDLGDPLRFFFGGVDIAVVFDGVEEQAGAVESGTGRVQGLPGAVLLRAQAPRVEIL